MLGVQPIPHRNMESNPKIQSVGLVSMVKKLKEDIKILEAENIEKDAIIKEKDAIIKEKDAIIKEKVLQMASIESINLKQKENDQHDPPIDTDKFQHDELHPVPHQNMESNQKNQTDVLVSMVKKLTQDLRRLKVENMEKDAIIKEKDTQIASLGSINLKQIENEQHDPPIDTDKFQHDEIQKLSSEEDDTSNFDTSHEENNFQMTNQKGLSLQDLDVSQNAHTKRLKLR